jgi:SpoVK/Ycf46/Vps4 family AAA+-type ATPase
LNFSSYGRLPRRILVDLPDLNTRKEILQVTLQGNRVADDVDLTSLAERLRNFILKHGSISFEHCICLHVTSLDGYTGSDIKEVCREAVVRVSHERAQQIESGSLAEDGRTRSNKFVC